MVVEVGHCSLLVPERLRVLKCESFFFLSSKSASTDWLRNNPCDVASRRKLAPRRRGRVVRAQESRPESPEFGSHSQQFEILGHALFTSWTAYFSTCSAVFSVHALSGSLIIHVTLLSRSDFAQSVGVYSAWPLDLGSILRFEIFCVTRRSDGG